MAVLSATLLRWLYLLFLTIREAALHCPVYCPAAGLWGDRRGSGQSSDASEGLPPATLRYVG